MRRYKTILTTSALLILFLSSLSYSIPEEEERSLSPSFLSEPSPLPEMSKTALNASEIQSDYDRIVALLAQNSEVNTPDENGWTPLHFAAQNGHVDLIQLLVKHKANINRQTNDEESALHLAAKNKHWDAFATLLALGDEDTLEQSLEKNIMDNLHETLMDRSQKGHQKEIARFFSQTYLTATALGQERLSHFITSTPTGLRSTYDLFTRSVQIPDTLHGNQNSFMSLLPWDVITLIKPYLTTEA